MGFINDQQWAVSGAGGGGEVVAEAAKGGRHGGGRGERSAQLLGQEGQELGRGHGGKGEVNRRHAQILGEAAGDQGLARAGRPEEQGGALAMFQAVPQPAQGGVATGQGDVGRRTDRLTKGPVLQAVMILVHARSPLTRTSRPGRAAGHLRRRGPREPEAGNARRSCSGCEPGRRHPRTGAAPRRSDR